MNQKRSEKAHRKQISEQKVKEAAATVRYHLLDRLDQKGYGTFVSRHELYGIIAEEYREFEEAVHSADLQNANAATSIKAELVDIAVGCIFGIACIDSNTLDW